MKTLLFVCTENAGRSQMALAWFRRLYRETLWKPDSGGTNPAPVVHSVVVEAMREVGIDISSAKPTMVSIEKLFSADLVVTMGCIKGCPPVPPEKLMEWHLDDPAEKSLDEVRVIRDEIRANVEDLIAQIG